MSRSKTIADYCDEAAARHALVDPQRQKFHMYKMSLLRRTEELPYALSELISAARATDTERTSQPLTAADLLRYRCATFWAMGYSVFDILANAANVVHAVEMDERDVSFKRIRLPEWQRAEGFVKAVEEVRKRRYFKRLETLRHCALHRRSVFITEQRTTIDPAYHEHDSTAAPIKQEWKVCTEPYALNPRIEDTIPLVPECHSIESKVKADLVTLIRKI